MSSTVERAAPVNIKVFISYCHESGEHDSQVRTLAHRLRREGIECVVDQDHQQEPSEGWVRWTLQHLRVSDFVLVVCTEAYDRHAQRNEPPEKGGEAARFEPVLTYQYLAFDEAIREKLIPVVFQEEDFAFVPRPLQPLPSYNVGAKSGYAALRSRLIGQPLREQPEPEPARDSSDLDRLVKQTYEQLRDMAHHQLLNWKGEETLDTTALVHETYLRLIDSDPHDLKDPMHLRALAAQVMRRILIDYARQRKVNKRGGDQQRMAFEEALNNLISGLNITVDEADELIGLDAALEKLAALNPRQAKIVALRFFGRMSFEEIAASLGISIETVQRDWQRGRAWLLREMRRKGGDEKNGTPSKS